MQKEPYILELDHWIIRVREPESTGSYPVILLLHGWTGDENAMWVFANRLPRSSLLISPCGLYPAQPSGYGWHPVSSNEAWPRVEDFKPAIERLLDLLTTMRFPNMDLSQISLVGFSQGTALSYTFALMYPERVTAVAGLSGFLPEGAFDLVSSRPLLGKRIFIAHGTRDELVSVERARLAVELLKQAGAQVTYCEDDVGHKLSTSCFHGLQAFFSSMSDTFSV